MPSWQKDYLYAHGILTSSLYLTCLYLIVSRNTSMPSFSASIAAIGVFLLSQPAVASGLGKSPFGWGVQSLAHFGLSPDQIINNQQSIHSLVSHSAMSAALETEYVTV